MNSPKKSGALNDLQRSSRILVQYLDGTLPWRQRVVFKLHLAFCRHCRRYLASYRETVRITRELGAPPSAEKQAVPEELVQAILAARRSGNGFAAGGDYEPPRTFGLNLALRKPKSLARPADLPAPPPRRLRLRRPSRRVRNELVDTTGAISGPWSSCKK